MNLCYNAAKPTREKKDDVSDKKWANNKI